MKSIMYTFCIIVICVIIIISLNTQDFDLFFDSRIKESFVTINGSYYLSEDGTLFCPEYNMDLNFVPTNKRKIISKNVKDFGANWLITENSEFYIWGLKRGFEYVPGYKYKGKINLIANNVISAETNWTYTAYINTNNELFVVGDAYGKKYNDFTKIADNAKQIECFNNELAYIDINNKLYQNGEIIFEDMSFKDVINFGTQTAMLTTNNELYFFGMLKSEEINNQYGEKIIDTLIDTGEAKVIKLKDNIAKISMGYNILGAIDESGAAYIWGYFYNNGDDNFITKDIKSFMGYKVAEKTKNIHITKHTISLIDENGKPYTYGVRCYLSGIGNSADNTKYYIGLNATEPMRWVRD